MSISVDVDLDRFEPCKQHWSVINTAAAAAAETIEEAVMRFPILECAVRPLASPGKDIHPRELSRRSSLLGILSLLCLPRAGLAQTSLPVEVAGIRLPRSSIALKAAQFARDRCPPFLFNHCLRTYLFGAVSMEHHNVPYDADRAYVAASLHDLGLVPAFESASGSFELDGADRAAQFARDNGLSERDAERVWQAIALHDGRFAFAKHQGGEAMLVAMGASSDVLGPDSDMVDAKRTAEIVAAFPRLQFKQRFLALAVEHCKRKPLSQRGTWLESLCREHVPSAWSETLEEDIAAAPFAE